MTGASPIYNWLDVVPFEIVEKGFSKARIIVYIEDAADSFHVSFRGKDVYVYGMDGPKSYYARIKLWFKVKKIQYRVKNGVLTIDARGRRFLVFLPI